MYVHLGDQVVVHSSDIIAILDYQTQDQHLLQEEHFLDDHRVRMIASSVERIKSVVITTTTIYLLPLSATALKRRITIISHVD